MWLYPLPALLATFGFLYVLYMRPNSLKEIRYAAVIVVAGTAIYLLRSWRRGEWPFPQNPALATASGPGAEVVLGAESSDKSSSIK